MTDTSGIIIPEEIWQNTALVYSEEWTHGLQYIAGRPIALKVGVHDEIDVAAYFLQEGISLPEEFLSRYNRRGELQQLGQL